MGHRFVKIIIDHTDRPKAATGQAFDEFNAVLPVLALEKVGVVAVGVSFDPGVLAKSLQEFIAAGHRARERAADPDMMFSRRLSTKHWIKSNQLQNIDWLDV